MGGGLMQLVAIHKKAMAQNEVQERDELRQSFKKPEDIRAFLKKHIGHNDDEPNVYLTMAIRRADALKGHYNLAYIIATKLPDEDFPFDTKPNGAKYPHFADLLTKALTNSEKPYGKMMEDLMSAPLDLKAGHSLVIDTKDEQKIYCDVLVGGKRFIWIARAGGNDVVIGRNGGGLIW